MTEFQVQSSRAVVCSVVLGCLLISVALIFTAVYMSDQLKPDNECPYPQPVTTEQTPTDSGQTAQAIKSGHGSYKYAAVASEDEICSEIGNDILARLRGHAVDATIATLLCNGVLHSQSSGIGGGAFFVIYDKEQGFKAINSREAAPAGASRDMFAKTEDRIKSRLGGLAVGIPGELKGMYEIHQKYGKVNWARLVDPTLNLVKHGYRLNKYVQERIVKLKDRTGFEVFLNDQGHPLPVGAIIRDPKLTKTFEIIRDDPMSFYNGDLAQDISLDIQEKGGIITTDDLKNYRAEWKNTTQMDLPGGYTMHSMPPPGSGVIIAHILAVLAGYNFDASSMSTDESKILTYHRIVEAFKFAYGKRSGLGDEDFVDVVELVSNLTSRAYGEETRKKITDDRTQTLDHYESYFYNQEDHGTNHLSVVDGEGNAVGVTTTVNLYFGSKVVGKRTGIVFNNEMDDFSTPNLTNAFGFLPSASNFIVPGKRPQSSMSPTIIFDNSKQKVKMVVGGAGGSRITSSTALLIMDVLWFKMSMGQAMDLARLHHQLMPNQIYVEPHFSPAVWKGLETKGHVVTPRTYLSICHGIDINDKSVDAACDYRKGGKPGGY